MSEKWDELRSRVKQSKWHDNRPDILELLDERDSLQEQLYDALKQLDAEKLGEKVTTIRRQQRAIEVLNAAVTEYGDYSKYGPAICQALAKAERILKGEE